MALADDKKTAIEQLYVIVKSRLELLTAPYSSFEQVAWALKLAESRAIIGGAGHTGLLLPEATATLRHLGITEPEPAEVYGQMQKMAEGIVSAADQLMIAEAELVGWRSARKYQIEHAPDSVALNRIDLTPPV